MKLSLCSYFLDLDPCIFSSRFKCWFLFLLMRSISLNLTPFIICMFISIQLFNNLNQMDHQYYIFTPFKQCSLLQVKSQVTSSFQNIIFLSQSCVKYCYSLTYYKSANLSNKLYTYIIFIMGEACSACDASDSETKHELKPLQPQIPNQIKNGQYENDNLDDSKFIMRENKKYTDDQNGDQFSEDKILNRSSILNEDDGEGYESGNTQRKREIIEFKNGIKYDGDMVNGQKQGKGIQWWPDGAIYDGQWAQNKANGKGIFTHPNGDQYNGQWKNDKAHGFGVFIHAKTGAKYQGYWENDMQHGSGIQIYEDGNRYQGMFKESKRHGEGTYEFADGAIFKGQWKNGRIQGKGVVEWKDGRRYEGEWMDNKKHGFGVFTWQDGRRYEGSYKNDKKHGEGTYTWADGRQHIGQWKNDKRHGFGKYILNKGSVKEGQWEQDKRIKWLNVDQDTHS